MSQSTKLTNEAALDQKRFAMTNVTVHDCKSCEWLHAYSECLNRKYSLAFGVFLQGFFVLFFLTPPFLFQVKNYLGSSDFTGIPSVPATIIKQYIVSCLALGGLFR